MTIYLGTQGWSYKDWLGSFYPTGTQAKDYLKLYAEVFDAVELDTTFYAIPRPDAVQSWDRSTPDGFQFTAKVPQSITHERRLIDAQEELAHFVEVMGHLGPKLGPLLLQMPPDFTFDEEHSLRRFLDELPEGFSFAIEFRNRSWLRDEVYDLLRSHGVAWTNIDLYYMPRHLELTSDFTYVRWLGDRRKIERMNEVQIDRTAELDAWAEKLDDVSKQVQRVYGFANNHYSGHSPSDIRHLRKRLGLPEREARREQKTLL